MNHLHCPHCKSTQIQTRDHARKVGGAVGTIAGTSIGVAGALNAGRIGMSVGLIAGPVGVAVGGIAGIVLGALCGGTTGCLAGAKLGEVVDRHVLNNHRCLQCGFTFSQAHEPLPDPEDEPYQADLYRR